MAVQPSGEFDPHGCTAVLTLGVFVPWANTAETLQKSTRVTQAVKNRWNISDQWVSSGCDDNQDACVDPRMRKDIRDQRHAPQAAMAASVITEINC